VFATFPPPSSLFPSPVPYAQDTNGEAGLGLSLGTGLGQSPERIKEEPSACRLTSGIVHASGPRPPLPLTFPHPSSSRLAINVADANWYVMSASAFVLSHRRFYRNGTSDQIVVSIPDALIHPFFTRDSSSDAQRPCSTCVRSHAHARTHAPAGVVLPERPDCTFDEGNDRILIRPPAVQHFKPRNAVASSAETQEPPKNRFEKLENRISAFTIAS
jgi:hypothetical protein